MCQHLSAFVSISQRPSLPGHVPYIIDEVRCPCLRHGGSQYGAQIWGTQIWGTIVNHNFKFLISSRIYFYNCNPVSISLYTMLGVLPSSASFNNTFSLEPDVHLESPTYNCPCEKTGDRKSNPTCFKDCP